MMTKRGVSTQEKYPEFLDDQRRFFDEIITEEWHTYQNPDWDERRRFEVDYLFRLVSPRTILDVGCGCGFHDALMAEKPGIEAVMGIDYSEKSVDAADREYPHPKVQRRVEDIRHLSVQCGYDLVVSFQVIEHLSDAAAFLADCRRQTVPGGHVAVVTPNRMRLSNRLRTLVGRQPTLGDPQHFREYVVSDLVALGKGAGLEYAGSFAYGITLHIPKTGKNLLPLRASLHLGHLLASLADCFCVVFKRGTRP